MDGGTAISLMVGAGILGPLAYWVWRWLAGLRQTPACGPACVGCAAAPTGGCALSPTRTPPPTTTSDPDVVREAVLYVSDLTEANASRLRAALLALDGVEAAAARPGTGTMQVTYRPARLAVGDLRRALEQATRSRGAEDVGRIRL